MADATSLTSERLKELLRYDSGTGEFFWTRGKRGARFDQPAGHVEPNGYRRIMVDGRRCFAHRLAWLYVYGAWPVGQLDHCNGKPDDNRIENIRLATREQNRANTRPRNPTGLKGAHFNRFRNYWQSYIKINGKSKSLGRFETAEAAHAAFMAAAREVHGEYVRGTR